MASKCHPSFRTRNLNTGVSRKSPSAAKFPCQVHTQHLAGLKVKSKEDRNEEKRWKLSAPCEIQTRYQNTVTMMLEVAAWRYSLSLGHSDVPGVSQLRQPQHCMQLLIFDPHLNGDKESSKVPCHAPMKSKQGSTLGPVWGQTSLLDMSWFLTFRTTGCSSAPASPNCQRIGSLLIAKNLQHCHFLR